MKDIIRPALALFTITAAFTLILAVTNFLTVDVIAEAREQARLAAMSYVLPGAAVFSSDTDIGSATGIMGYAVGFADGTPVGVVVQMSVTAWSPNLVFLVGIDLDGAVTGLDVISHTETPGLGSRIADEAYRHQFIGATGDVQVLTRGTAGENQVMAITGATFTIQVVTDGVNDALEFVKASVLPNIHRYLPQ